MREGEGAHLGCIRRHDLDRDAVAIAHRVDHVMRLLGQPAGVERDHMLRAADARRHVDEHRRLGLKAGHDRELWKRGLCPPQHRLRILTRHDLRRGYQVHRPRSIPASGLYSDSASRTAPATGSSSSTLVEPTLACTLDARSGKLVIRPPAMTTGPSTPTFAPARKASEASASAALSMIRAAPVSSASESNTWPASAAHCPAS